jgi:hypothetical protein
LPEQRLLDRFLHNDFGKRSGRPGESVLHQLRQTHAVCPIIFPAGRLGKIAGRLKSFPMISFLGVFSARMGQFDFPG